MNPVTEILTELYNRGVHIEPRPHGGVRLVPARLIDPDLFNRICVHKTELLALLASRQEEERREADRRAKRGYDVDSSAPSAHALRQAALEEARSAGRWLPPCPACRGARYWLTLTGNVICGSCCAAYWRVEELRVAPLQ